MSAPALEVRDLTVAFRGDEGDRVTVLERVGFTLARGRTLCLVGESGCGKSVTALAVMGLLAENAELLDGSLRLDGRELVGLGRDELGDLRGSRMAMVFQEPMTSLNPVFAVGDQLCEALRRHQPLAPEAVRERALEMLRRVRIPAPEQRLGEYPHQLSGGMRQRVMIAMALANDPGLLIADEPTTALDVTIQAQILALVRRLQEETGTTVLMITHDLGVVAEVGDEVAVMYAGRIVELASVERLFADPQHPYTIGLLSSIPRLDRAGGRLPTIPGAVPAPGEAPSGCRFSNRCPFADSQCLEREPPLRALPDGGHSVACWKAPVEQLERVPA